MHPAGMARRGLAAVLIAVAAIFVGVGPLAGPAVAAEEPSQISATIAPAARPSSNPNIISVDIQVTNTETKAPPVFVYEVFLDAREGTGESESILRDLESCELLTDNDPSAPRGVYQCSVLVDRPGTYTLTAFVNQPTAAGQVQLEVLELAVTDTDAIELAGLDRGLAYIVEGSSFDVFLLQFHVALAALWLLIAGALAFVAVPRLRRMLAARSLQALEVRRGFLASTMWTAFGGTLITGTYLLSTQTAFEAPFRINSFSFSDYSNITSLPYARVYLNALYLKILVFFAMAAATYILAAEATRQAQTAQDAADDDEPVEVDMWASGVHFDEEGHVLRDESASGASVATARRTRPDGAAVSPRTLWTSVWVILVGTAVIGACVTVLKYNHELAEAAEAARILRGFL